MIEYISGKVLKNYFATKFDSFYQKLPPYVKKQAIRVFEHFTLDTRYPSLEFKCVNQQLARYSICINNKGYHALGYMQEQGESMLWYWILDRTS